MTSLPAAAAQRRMAGPPSPERQPIAGMFLSLSTELVADGAALDAAVDDIAGKGFDLLYLQWRDALWGPLDPPAIAAAHRAIRRARRHRMQVWAMICPDNVNGPERRICEAYRDELQEVVNPYAGELRGGRCAIDLVQDERIGRDLLGLERAWRPLPGDTR